MRPARLSDDAVRWPALAVATHRLMVTLMSLTPLRAHHMGMDHTHVAGLITLHVAGMFGFGWLTGPLLDRLGSRFGYVTGAALLAAASLTALLTGAWLPVSMFVLGLGWNLCYVAGSKALTAYAGVQGQVDALGYLAAAPAPSSAGRHRPVRLRAAQRLLRRLRPPAAPQRRPRTPPVTRRPRRRLTPERPRKTRQRSRSRISCNVSSNASRNSSSSARSRTRLSCSVAACSRAQRTRAFRALDTFPFPATKRAACRTASRGSSVGATTDRFRSPP